LEGKNLIKWLFYDESLFVETKLMSQTSLKKKRRRRRKKKEEKQEKVVCLIHFTFFHFLNF